MGLVDAAFLAFPAGRAAAAPDARFVAVVDFEGWAALLTGRGGLNAGPFRFCGFDMFGAGMCENRSFLCLVVVVVVVSRVCSYGRNDMYDSRLLIARALT